MREQTLPHEKFLSIIVFLPILGRSSSLRSGKQARSLFNLRSPILKYSESIFSCPTASTVS